MTRKKLTEELKETLRMEFVQGIVQEDGFRSYPTIESLVQQYEIPQTTLYRYAKREQWKEQRKTFQSQLFQKSDDFKQSELASKGQDLDIQSLAIAQSIMDTLKDKLESKRREELQGRDGFSGTQLLALSSSALNAQKLAKLALGETTEKVAIDGDTASGRAFSEVMSLLDTVRDTRRASNGGGL